MPLMPVVYCVQPDLDSRARTKQAAVLDALQTALDQNQRTELERKYAVRYHKVCQCPAAGGPREHAGFVHRPSCMPIDRFDFLSGSSLSAKSSVWRSSRWTAPWPATRQLRSLCDFAMTFRRGWLSTIATTGLRATQERSGHRRASALPLQAGPLTDAERLSCSMYCTFRKEKSTSP